VQPGRSLTLTNLRDLGVHKQTFAVWSVNLPVGGKFKMISTRLSGPRIHHNTTVQEFTFAYNTLANPTVVFQSGNLSKLLPKDLGLKFSLIDQLLQVGPGTDSCMTQNKTSNKVNTVSGIQLATRTGMSFSTSVNGSVISSTADTGRSTSVAGIVGGLLSSLFVAAMLVYILFRLRRRRLRHKYVEFNSTRSMYLSYDVPHS